MNETNTTNSNKNEKTLAGIMQDPNVAENVIWTVMSMADFRQAVLPFAEDAQKNGKKVIYIHYSGCDTLFDGAPLDPDRFEMHEASLTHRFEAFTVDVYERISEGPEGGVLYLFDPLSSLQAAWATDLMMENFVSVITKIIHEKRATAFYPLLRGNHSLQTYEHIKARCSAYVEVYSDFKALYLRPVNLTAAAAAQPATAAQAGAAAQAAAAAEPPAQPRPLSREEQEQLLTPHIFDAQKGVFLPITDGVLESRFRKAVNTELKKGRKRGQDSWDRFFDRVQRDYEDGRDISADLTVMINIMMSRDAGIRELLERHFEPEDYFFVKEHMIGTGVIGGKSCGMLTARKIIENLCPDIHDRLEPHDSFFVGSDVFYTYIVENDFWRQRVAQRKREGYFALAEEMADKLLHGVFPEAIREQFRELLDFYGPSPVIVRSSSILEDGFGNAFAGKYESVFCPGNGTPEERLEEFENAVRVVYASTLSKSALDYRLRRGLADRDEQMALLVQRVSGSRFGEYYFPCAAGVGYSYSTYRFMDSLDPKAGMLRLVMGLGTGAVDRTQGSYPRLVSLDKPEATPYKSRAEHHKFSQRSVDLLQKSSGELETVPFYRIEKLMPGYILKAVCDHDYEAERSLMNRGTQRNVWYISCGGLVKNRQLMEDMQTMMQTLQQEYGQPVDIEFTINVSEEGEYVINLLQCRPLQAFEDSGRQGIPEDLNDDEVVLDCSKSTLGKSQKTPVDLILYVDPVAYYEMPFKQKREVTKWISAVNWYYRDKDKTMLLMVPGRICTSSPELGVPTVFSDISSFAAIFEMAESRAGYNPELSYGSHIFQDLVESEILYAAVFEDNRRRIYRPEMFIGLKNRISEIEPAPPEIENIVRLYDVADSGCTLIHDLLHQRIVITMDRK